MTPFIPAADRINKSRAMIQKAREVPVPAGGGRGDFSYIAQVKDLLRQARDLVKFIPQTPSASPEMKAEVQQIFQEIEQAGREILGG
jgi:hypothetical protein